MTATIRRDRKFTELRALLQMIAPDWPADERLDALEAACADPDGALRSYRVLAARRANTGAPEPPGGPDERLRACRDCANLSAGGRCMAAHRGEPLGDGIAPISDFSPAMVHRPQRCLAYSPGLRDRDRRTGMERWGALLQRDAP